MKYLLSNGLKTSDIITYIKDVLFINLNVQPIDIPFNKKLGVNKVKNSDGLLELEDKSRELVTDLLTRLSKRHSIVLTLSKLEVTSNNIDVTININNKDSGSYSIDILK